MATRRAHAIMCAWRWPACSCVVLAETRFLPSFVRVTHPTVVLRRGLPGGESALRGDVVAYGIHSNVGTLDVGMRSESGVHATLSCAPAHHHRTSAVVIGTSRATPAPCQRAETQENAFRIGVRVSVDERLWRQGDKAKEGCAAPRSRCLR